VSSIDDRGDGNERKMVKKEKGKQQETSEIQELCVTNSIKK
jgi:hypothetical protein